MQIENKMAPLIQPSEAGPKYFPMASNLSELSLWEHLWSRKSTSDRYTAQGEVLCIWCKRLTKLHSLVLPWLLRLSLFGSSCYFWWSSSSPLLLILISSNNVLALGVQTSSVNLLRCCSCRWIISTMEAVNWQVWRTCSVVVLPRKRGLWQSVRPDNLHYACSMADCNLVARNGTARASFPTDSLAMLPWPWRNSWNCHFNGTGLIVLTDPRQLASANASLFFHGYFFALSFFAYDCCLFDCRLWQVQERLRRNLREYGIIRSVLYYVYVPTMLFFHQS